jgi:uncharacterized membrane protein YvbJ
MFCVHCGNKLDDDAVFCTNCGKKVVDDNDSLPAPVIVDSNNTPDKNEVKTNKPSVGRLIRYIIALVFSVIPIFSFYYTIPVFIIGLKTRKKSKTITILAIIAFALSIICTIALFVYFIIDESTTPLQGPSYNWPTII